jgi:hypothetical protein
MKRPIHMALGKRKPKQDELDMRANVLATCLRARDIGPEMLVGLCVERSEEMLVGLLGVLKAGAAYVPMETNLPRRRLAALFGLSAMELETAVRHAIPIIVVVQNNDGIVGSTRQSSYFPADYPELFSQLLPAVRYERLMEAFGGHAEWVEETRDIRPALERALQSNRPACLNVRVKPDAPHPGFW